MHKKNLIKLILLVIFVFFSYLPIKAEAACCKVNQKTNDLCNGLEYFNTPCDEVPPSACILSKEEVSDDKCIVPTTKKEVEKADPIKTEINVSIPDSDFTAGKQLTFSQNADILVNYIVAIFKYSMGVIGIIAAIILMYGGVRWLTAGGNQATIAEAKTYVISSLSGLVLTLSSFLILSTINFNLINLKVPEIKYIDYAPLDSLSPEEYKKNIDADPPVYGPPPAPSQSLNNYKNNTITYQYKKYVKNLFSVYPVLASMPPNQSDFKVFYQCSNKNGINIRDIDYSAGGTCTENHKTTNENNGKYGINNASNICTSGCGFLALYNTLYAYGKAGEVTTELRAMVQLAEEKGWRKNGQGTKQEAIIAYAKKKNLTAKVLQSLGGNTSGGGIEAAFQYVEKGWPVIASVGASKFTTGGHFIVLAFTKGDTMYVLDSANPPEDYDPKREYVTKSERSSLPWNTLTVLYPNNIDDPVKSCVDLWDWKCSYKKQNCCSGRCIYNDENPSCSPLKIDNTNCYQCGSCIKAGHWGCRNNSDCCSGSCHTKAPNKYQCD